MKIDWMDWTSLGRELTTWTWLDASKILLSAFVIVLVTKVQVVNDRLSALLIALPLTSLLAMIWMKSEKQSDERIANHAESTFWFVLPTLPMFLLLPWMLRRGWSFGWSLAANCVLTVLLFWCMGWFLRRAGVRL